jgi:hydroxymethylbilane synthase
VSRAFVIGARGSALSLRQVEIVSAALRGAHPGLRLELREIRTHGDASSAPLAAIGGLGAFTKAIEDALLDGTADIAVHSLKDLPARLADGLVLGAVPAREDVRDALVTRDGSALTGLAAGARIGTGSERRAEQLRELRADIETAEIRGNVPTRVAKVDAGDYDGVVLAMAGLRRLGLDGRAAQVFSIEEMTPAVGQGALGIEVRAGDAEALEVVQAIDDAAARAAVTAERAFLGRLGAGCRLPVGAYGAITGETLSVRGVLGGEGGLRRAEVAGALADAAVLGVRLADDLMRAGQ